jgi:8-oxo-dGTP pyrophosphatase MutT (NUDIX family)
MLLSLRYAFISALSSSIWKDNITMPKKHKKAKHKKPKKPRIRPLALAVIRHMFEGEAHIFVGENTDETTGNIFYRPIGGGIDFGELGQDCVVREWHEETGLLLRDVRYLGALESIFSYQGRAGHEIVLIYEAHFVDEACYAPDFTVLGEDDGETLFTGRWMPLVNFAPERIAQGAPPLYPNSLFEMLQSRS